MNSDYYVRFQIKARPNPSILTDAVRCNANIGESYWETSLDKIPPSFIYKTKVLTYLRKLQDWEPEGVGLLLHGQHGSGKTSLGSIVLRNVIAREGRGFMISAGELFDKLIRKPAVILPNKATLEECVKNVQFLMIDDLKEWLSHEWKDRVLEEVVRARYDDRLPTIITTNLPMKTLQECAWLWSLIQERFLQVEVAGIEWRKSIGQRGSH